MNVNDIICAWNVNSGGIKDVSIGAKMHRNAAMVLKSVKILSTLTTNCLKRT